MMTRIFFDQQSTKKIRKEARQDRSGSGKGTTILVAKTVESMFVWVFIMVTTLVGFAYLCRKSIGGPWIGQGKPMTDAGEQVQKLGEGPDGRGYSVSQARWWWGFFRPAVHQEDLQGGSSGPFRLGEGDNHTHCQNFRIKACFGVCSCDNTCEFCISLQEEDTSAMDWARCANERRKESKSRSRERAQMDEDTVFLELDDDEDFFQLAVHQEDQEGGSSGPFRLAEGDNHTHCQNCRIKACLGVCSCDNTCEFCISLQEEDCRAMDWARCANERHKESKPRSREKAKMDEDTVSLEPDDDEDFFDQQSTKKIYKEARQDRSGSGTKTRKGPSPGDTSSLPWEKGVEPDFFTEDEAGVCSCTTSRVGSCSCPEGGGGFLSQFFVCFSLQRECCQPTWGGRGVAAGHVTLPIAAWQWEETISWWFGQESPGYLPSKEIQEEVSIQDS